MSNKPYIGDTPEQLNCKLAHIDSALLVDGFVYTEDVVRQLKAERDALSAEVKKLTKDRDSWKNAMARAASVLLLHKLPTKTINVDKALAEIRAEAVEGAAESTRQAIQEGGQKWLCRVIDLKAHAEKIRQGGE